MLTPERRPASMSARASRGAKHCEIPKWEFLLRNESTLRAPTYATIRSFMGWTRGFEPPTTGITIRDSTVELRPPRENFHGLPDRTRTCDPQLRRLMLYPD